MVKKTASQMAAERAEKEAAKAQGKKAPSGQRAVKHYTIANRLKELREASKLKMSDIANGTGIGTQTVAAVEAGADTSLSRALMLAAFYEVPVNEIWTGEPVEKTEEVSPESPSQEG